MHIYLYVNIPIPQDVEKDTAILETRLKKVEWEQIKKAYDQQFKAKEEQAKLKRKMNESSMLEENEGY